MNEIDDTHLKAEIDDIMDRVNRIMEEVDELNSDQKETAEKNEE